MSNDWPFEDPPNVVCFVHKKITGEGHPILLFIRSDDDGSWQALTGDEIQSDDELHCVCLSHIVNMDPSIKELADLPIGWWATRESPASPWRREPIPPEERSDAEDDT